MNPNSIHAFNEQFKQVIGFKHTQQVRIVRLKRLILNIVSGVENSENDQEES